MHFKKSKINLFSLCLCGLMFLLAGCASAPVDFDKITNPNKPVEQTVTASMLTAYKASMDALGELNMSVLGDSHGDLSVEIKSRTSDNEVAWVEIKSIGADVCTITVCVDVFSSEARSRSILTSIVNKIPYYSASSKIRKEAKPNVSSQQSGGNAQVDDIENDELKPIPKDEIGEKKLM